MEREMKKRFLIAAVATMVMSLFALALFGCGGGGAGDTYVGTYPLTSFDGDGTTVSGDDLESVLPQSDNYIEIKDGKNITFTLMGSSIDSTYTVDGTTMSVVDGEDILDFEISGDTITYTLDEGTLTFTKK
jgi:hypothetical protein